MEEQLRNGNQKATRARCRIRVVLTIERSLEEREEARRIRDRIAQLGNELGLDVRIDEWNSYQ